MASQFYNDSIFWIEIDKVKPNPYQPRHEFDEARLRDLADSIRMYGILQPLVVTRKEFTKEDGGLGVEYELISGERRLRASKIAGLAQVPALIRSGEEDARVKLELAIIENLQREDLNPIDRALAFNRLVKDFNFKHSQIAAKMGKSREYVTNSLRLLALPPALIEALQMGKISEGHARPLLMLNDRPEEQTVLFKEITYKKLTVREAESIARKIAVEKARNKDSLPEPEIMEMEAKLAEHLGTRVKIDRKEGGGKIVIDFFSQDDLHHIYDIVKTHKATSSTELLKRHEARINAVPAGAVTAAIMQQQSSVVVATAGESSSVNPELSVVPLAVAAEAPLETPIDDRAPVEIKKEEDEDELYSIKNFSL